MRKMRPKVKLWHDRRSQRIGRKRKHGRRAPAVDSGGRANAHHVDRGNLVEAIFGPMLRGMKKRQAGRMAAADAAAAAIKKHRNEKAMERQSLFQKVWSKVTWWKVGDRDVRGAEPEVLESRRDYE